MNNRQSTLRSRLAIGIPAILLIGIVGLIFFTIQFSIPPSDTFLNRAHSMPPGTTEADVIAALHGSTNWAMRPQPGGYVNGYEVWFYPSSLIKHQLVFTSAPPFVRDMPYMPLDAKAVVVHFDGSKRLSSVDPETRTWR